MSKNSVIVRREKSQKTGKNARGIECVKLEGTWALSRPVASFVISGDSSSRYILYCDVPPESRDIGARMYTIVPETTE
jgi:hypothetical protein